MVHLIVVTDANHLPAVVVLIMEHLTYQMILKEQFLKGSHPLNHIYIDIKDMIYQVTVSKVRA